MERILRKNDTKLSQAGFTLVETLVVISIVGLLAGLVTVAVPRAMEAGKKAKAKGELTAIVAAVKAYKQEYGRWPCRAQDYTRSEYYCWYGPPTELEDGKILFRILAGENISFSGDPTFMNPKQVRFLEGVKMSTGRRDTTGGTLVDPWGGQYAVKMDVDESGGVEYFETTGTNDNVKVSVIALSFGAGPKNSAVNSAGRQEDPDKIRTPNCDDVFSWR